MSSKTMKHYELFIKRGNEQLIVGLIRTSKTGITIVEMRDYARKIYKNKLKREKW